MKRAIFAIMAAAFLLGSCSNAPPKPVELAYVCNEAKGTGVVLNGYFSLPSQLEMIRRMRDGREVEIDYRLHLIAKKDATGDAVPVLISGTNAPEKNKMMRLPYRHTLNDLVAYTDEQKAATAGQKVRITGTIEADGKEPCRVNVSKIESFEQPGQIAGN